MDDLLQKYLEELQKELGDKWVMYALDEENVIVSLDNKILVCEYENKYKYVKDPIVTIDLKNAKYSYTPKFEKQSVKTRATLTKLAGEFMFDYNNQPRLKIARYVFNNIKKVNENLISFDVFYNENTILKNIEWNGKSLKSLKVVLLDNMIKCLGTDKASYIKDILGLCEVLEKDKFYCKFKGFAQQVLNETPKED